MCLITGNSGIPTLHLFNTYSFCLPKIAHLYLAIHKSVVRKSLFGCSRLVVAARILTREMVTISTRCLRTSLQHPWVPTTRSRSQWIPGSNALVLPSVLSKTPVRRVYFQPMRRARGISSRAGNNHHDANRARLGTMLAISISAALGITLYLRQQNSIRMDWSMGNTEPAGAGSKLSTSAVWHSLHV